jgi:hypothetical protein
VSFFDLQSKKKKIKKKTDALELDGHNIHLYFILLQSTSEWEQTKKGKKTLVSGTNKSRKENTKEKH